jgi:hypothetical protein
MRLFVLYNRDGTIRSAMKIGVMGVDLDHSYALLEEGEAVLETKVTDKLGALAPGEICERFAVDLQTRELVAKGAFRMPPRCGRRRRPAGGGRIPTQGDSDTRGRHCPREGPPHLFAVDLPTAPEVAALRHPDGLEGAGDRSSVFEGRE